MVLGDELLALFDVRLSLEPLDLVRFFSLLAVFALSPSASRFGWAYVKP
jgi:hypothetical protein